MTVLLILAPLFVIAQSLSDPLLSEQVVFQEENGLVAVEAEYFYQQTQTEARQWYRTSREELPKAGRDEDGPHCKDAGNNAYLEILPDTRVTHADKLIRGDNFSNEAGKMAILHYKVHFQTPGRYYVWARAFSAGGEDNGLHVGIDGTWPASGQRLQWCEGKHAWRWESKQRTEAVHCGEPHLIYLDIETAGLHDIQFSMREDGFEFDRFLLTREKNYVPNGIGPEVKTRSGNLPAPFPVVAHDPEVIPPASSPAEIQGELKKWHRTTLVFDGPNTSEMAEENPFLRYRLDVTFTRPGKTYVVPGFYAADGNAAETSAAAGNKWMVRFSPDEAGEWTYAVSFKKGEKVAVSDDPDHAQSAGFMDGQTGSFEIGPTDKTGKDNRAQGRLEYVGESYLKYAETGKYFIKAGVDAPENLLGYEDFDATTNVFGLRKNWEPHRQDFPAAADGFLWQGEKGKNLLGAIHYLASEELNVFSFLTFNVDGDDRNVFPYLLKTSAAEYTAYANEKPHKEAWKSFFHTTRLDVSKLEQWERIFEYAEQEGMFLHFKTHETETDHLMDEGVFGTEGKLYYRELIARFGHHLSMNWNLGEENNQPIEEVKKVAAYVHQLDPYQHHLVIHTFPNQDDRYAELIGDQSPLTGASLQLSDPEFKDVHPRVLKWKEKSEATGKKWALAVDEPGKANIALLPDAEDAEHNLARSQALWGTLMAGGYGVEWYFGYASPHSDLTCQDFRSRDLFWDQNRHARTFFEEHIPFWKMKPADEWVAAGDYCLADPGEVYVVFLQQGQGTIDLTGQTGRYQIRWFDPRNGGELQMGKVKKCRGGASVRLTGAPSEPEKDWIGLIQKK